MGDGAELEENGGIGGEGGYACYGGAWSDGISYVEGDGERVIAAYRESSWVTSWRLWRFWGSACARARSCGCCCL